MITVTIDNIPRQTDEGRTILEVTKAYGIAIPTLCYLEDLNPLGSCRMCLVEIDGVADPLASCATPAVDGMVVRTQSERLTALRRQALQFMLADHPLDCPVCDKAGECRLQDLTYQLGVSEHAFTLEKHPFRIDKLSPLIERYDSRCVRCGRCVSICQERQGFGAYVYRDNGYHMAIDTVDGKPLNCDFCGQCVVACPVGALINKQFKYRCRAWQLEKADSVCPYCGAGCRILLNTYKDKVYRITPREESNDEKGLLCGRAVFGFGFGHRPERLHSPQIRRNGQLQDVSWEEALDFAAEKLRSLPSKAGMAAGIGSVRTSNEDSYLFQKFFRQVLGSPHIDSYNRFGYAQAWEILHGLQGTLRPAFPFADVGQNDALLLIGCDLAAEMPVPSLHLIRAAREGKTKLIHALPMTGKMDRFAHLRLRYRPGTETSLIAGLIKAVIDSGRLDRSYIDKATRGFDEFARSLQGISLEKVSQVTGVDEKLIQQAADTLATAGKASIVFGYYLISQKSGREAVSSLADLALLTGMPGKKGCGLYPAAEKNNQLGSLAMGVLPDRLPGFRPLAAGASLSRFYGNALPKEPGKTFFQMIEAIEKGEIRALYVMGAAPLAEFPQPRRLRQALAKLDLLLVQDIFPSALLDAAHVVLPAASYAEKEGTFLNADGLVQNIQRAVSPPASSRADWRIIQDLAKRLGADWKYAAAADVTAEIRSCWPGFADVSSPTPVPQRIEFPPLVFPAGEAENGFPFRLLIGPSPFHCGTLSTHAEGLLTLAAHSVLEMNGEDAARLRLKPGDRVRVSSQHESLSVPLKPSSRIPAGVLFLPKHFADVSVNALGAELAVVRVKLEM